ncbi:MAG: hypothetical protein AAFY17_01755 [Cyanobacteria bacterium J06642_11]
MPQATSTAVLYTQAQALQFLQDQPHAKRLYPLTPNALAAVLDHTQLPVLSPLTVVSDRAQQQLVDRVRQAESAVWPQICDAPDLSVAGKTVFRNKFHVFTCSVFYLYEVLRGTGPWLIHDGQTWHPIEDLNHAVELLFQYVYDRGYGAFSISIGSNQRGKMLLQMLNFILITCFIKPRCIWLTGYEYNLKALSAEIPASEKGISVLFPGVANGKSVCRTLKTLSEQFFPRRHSKSAVEYVPVLSPKQDYREFFSKTLASSQVFKSPLIEKACINFTNTHVSYTEALIPHLESLFQRIKPERVIAHHLRWMAAPALAQVAQSQDIDCTLISHGSHGVPENPTAQYAQDHLADGLLVSALATETITQSPVAEQAASKLAPTLKRRRSSPLMWGHEVPPPDCQKDVFTILQAGTYKVLGGRPWIYETSSEFVHGLQQLVQAIQGIEHIHLIIRVREEPQECTLSALKQLLPETPNWELSTTGYFRDDLQRSDMLISFSSTTLEEALFARRPVGLFGGSSRYRHLAGMAELPSPERRSAVYHLNANTLRGMLCRVAEVHINQPLSDEELRPYVWGRDVPGWQNFVNELV